MDLVAYDGTSTSDSGQEIYTAADLARLRNSGKPLTLQEMKELNTRIKAFEEMARMEDRLRALESRKRPRSELSKDAQPLEEPSPKPLPTWGSGNSPSHLDCLIRPLIKLDNSNSSSSTIVRPYKQQCFIRGIKVILSYTFKVSSSLRE